MGCTEVYARSSLREKKGHCSLCTVPQKGHAPQQNNLNFFRPLDACTLFDVQSNHVAKATTFLSSYCFARVESLINTLLSDNIRHLGPLYGHTSGFLSKYRRFKAFFLFYLDWLLRGEKVVLTNKQILVQLYLDNGLSKYFLSFSRSSR